MKDEEWVIEWIGLVCDSYLDDERTPSEEEYDQLLLRFDEMNLAEQRLLFSAVLRGLFVSALWAEDLERRYE